MTSRTANSRATPGGGGRARSRKPAIVAVATATAPSALVSDAKIGSLKRLNDGVEHARASTDLLYRLITEPSGTDLRALVARIKTHVCGMANELRIDQQRTAFVNEQQKRLAASFTQKPIVDDDLQCLNHLFDKLCGLEVNANDDKARIAQLACVFSILTTDIDIRRQLVGSDNNNNNDDDDRKSANLIDKHALTLFLQHDARQLMTSYRDGNMTALDYVDRCVTAYLSYLPTLTPRVARSFFAASVAET
jgi:hypothetical protein